ncbi:GNAT family N-acetyltransferase [Neobacillus niacini]|uniref:GNAT family N-acetyltransferase n=1 Tax=Neobacillus niacini TaxID=86668 RepID=UPI001C8D4CEA|nr:GNAT family N-acetyltransferase [Neobacillus niacini]MBY0146275.1 GNAT family N-acetyltransferase [Neobacillus niacini]
MKVVALEEAKVQDFAAYCRKHRSEVDDSYLYDFELRDFQVGDENPTYILINEKDDIVGSASLVMDDYHIRGKRARFRIFHSEVEDIQCYQQLLKNLLNHTKNLEKVFLFIPVVNKKLIEIIQGMKFSLERYAFLLVREDLEVPDNTLPEGYELRPFQQGQDEENWALVRNAAFSTLKGSETPITIEGVTKLLHDDDYLEGGMLLLFHHGRPVGVIRGADDGYEDAPIMNIGPVAVTPEYQGRGLGRILLRASLQFAREKGYKRTILSVNGENERAQALYIQEGFKQVEAVVCYQYFL